MPGRPPINSGLAAQAPARKGLVDYGQNLAGVATCNTLSSNNLDIGIPTRDQPTCRRPDHPGRHTLPAAQRFEATPDSPLPRGRANPDHTLMHDMPRVLDGGLATQLETRGHDLSDALWSARLLMSAPDEIAAVHTDYLAAGAECITTASYQASLEGFLNQGVELAHARHLIGQSVQLAIRARDQYWTAHGRAGSQRPWVAASVGPYGAFLANGAEYTGHYDRDAAGLRKFHEQRWSILAAQRPDRMLCETIPSRIEARVLAELASDQPAIPCWISLNLRDPERLADGSPLADLVGQLDQVSAVEAIGINCVAPSIVERGIAVIRRRTRKPVIAYPNSGEVWDAAHRRWRSPQPADECEAAINRWLLAGASLIGGCCRTDPDFVCLIQKLLSSRPR